jgi:hypothetical protein
MKLKFISLFITLTFFKPLFCSAAQSTSQIDSLGIKISTVSYKVKATPTDSADFENGIIPWINLENTTKEIDRLIDGEEIVLPFTSITIIIDYTLKNQVTFDITTTTKGFSRNELAIIISKKYHEIYQEEEKSTAVVVIPIDQRKDMVNRNQTNGKYGICCHDLSDLDLSSIDVFKNANGKIYLLLNIES